MKTIVMILLAASMVFSPHILPAQTLTVSGLNTVAAPVQSAAPDSIVQITAEAQGLQLVSPDNLPPFGTYWEVMPYGVIAPLPCPPFDPTLPVYAVTDNIFLVDATCGQLAANPRQTAAMSTTAAVNDAAASLATAVVNLINQVQTAQANQQARATMQAMGMDVPSPGDGGSGGGYLPMFSGGTPIDTNALWLEITNVSNGWSHLNLHNATNLVYAIWTTTNLLTPFAVETELWPTDTNCQPFTLQNSDRQYLFVRAEDWTGVDSDQDGVPDWWAWKYFANVNLTDTNLDYSGNGYTFSQDYSNSNAPTVFIYSGIYVTNNYVNTCLANVQLNVAGTPYYIAVSVDDANYLSDTAWQNYSGSNVTVNLGLTEGWHNVWIGLRGHADDPTNAIWQSQRLKLDWTPPPLVITSPTNGTINQPMIQLTGYSSEELSAITYDISNAVGLISGQPVYITSQFTDTNTWEFTTNYFQGFDIPLTNGVNIITLHATDMAGNTTTTNLTFTLDYSGVTNPPLIQIAWPQDGTQVSGTSFTLDGQVDNPTASVSASIVETNGNTNTISGLVGRDGKFWVEGIPLNVGTNTLTLTVMDAAGNSTVTNISVVQTEITLAMDDVTPDSQLWQPTVNVTGKISDVTYAIWVNGVKGHNNGDGTWSANNVPTTQGGTASFTITGYAPNEQQPDGSYGN